MTGQQYFTGYVTLKRWLENRNRGKRLVEHFAQHGYKRIGVYGAGDLGMLLYAEIMGSGIEIVFFVDINAESLGEVSGIPVITVDELARQEDVDAIIVTPVDEFDTIFEELTRLVPEMAVMSLYDALYEF